MTCWIEDDLANEGHGGPLLIIRTLKQVGVAKTAGRNEWAPRSCSAFCTDEVHATIVFVAARVANVEAHCVGQFHEHHGAWSVVVKAEPAHEVTPDMYPERVHRGAPAEHGEGITAWLVFFKDRPR